MTYSADGMVSGLDLRQIGVAFELETLRHSHYAGTVSGGFNLTGVGSTLDDLTIDVKGTRVNAAMFGGGFADTALDLQVRNDSLSGSGAGRFERIDPGAMGPTRPAFSTAGSIHGTMPGCSATGFALTSAP